MMYPSDGYLEGYPEPLHDPHMYPHYSHFPPPSEPAPYYPSDPSGYYPPAPYPPQFQEYPPIPSYEGPAPSGRGLYIPPNPAAYPSAPSYPMPGLDAPESYATATAGGVVPRVVGSPKVWDDHDPASAGYGAPPLQVETFRAPQPMTPPPPSRSRAVPIVNPRDHKLHSGELSSEHPGRDSSASLTHIGSGGGSRRLKIIDPKNRTEVVVGAATAAAPAPRPKPS
eukprot:RCo042299